MTPGPAISGDVVLRVNAAFLAEGTVVDANGFVETDSNGNGTLYHIFSVEAQSVPEPPAVALLGVAILLIDTLLRSARGARRLRSLYR